MLRRKGHGIRTNVASFHSRGPDDAGGGASQVKQPRCVLSPRVHLPQGGRTADVRAVKGLSTSPQLRRLGATVRTIAQLPRPLGAVVGEACALVHCAGAIVEERRVLLPYPAGVVRVALDHAAAGLRDQVYGAAQGDRSQARAAVDPVCQPITLLDTKRSPRRSRASRERAHIKFSCGDGLLVDIN